MSQRLSAAYRFYPMKAESHGRGEGETSGQAADSFIFVGTDLKWRPFASLTWMAFTVCPDSLLLIFACIDRSNIDTNDLFELLPVRFQQLRQRLRQ